MSACMACDGDCTNPHCATQGDLLLDLAAAEQAADEAITRVRDHADPQWTERALDVIWDLAIDHATLTTDDVWAALANVDTQTHEPRAMGAVMRVAAGKGWVYASDQYRKSERAACHARPLRVWVSRIHHARRTA